MALGLASVALLVDHVGPASTTSAASGEAAAARESRGVYWGAWIGAQFTGTPAPPDMEAVNRFEQVAGKGLSLLEFARPLAHCEASQCSFQSFPSGEMDQIRRHGAIPVLSWTSASDPPTLNEPEFQLQDVIAGRYDGPIRRFAEGVSNWGHPFFLRWNWEMNGNWFPWAGRANGNRPSEFVIAWRHVHRIFTAAGATNASWVWCPYVDSTGKQNLRGLYPGRAYVDWTCLDGYNWGPGSPSTPRPWRSFNQIFRPTYLRIVRRIAPRKPMILAELASSPYGGSKAAWIRRMLADIPVRYPRIRGFVWFDEQDRNAGWPIEQSADAANAFREGIANPVYKANVFGGISARPIRPPR